MLVALSFLFSTSFTNYFSFFENEFVELIENIDMEEEEKEKEKNDEKEDNKEDYFHSPGHHQLFSKTMTNLSVDISIYNDHHTLEIPTPPPELS